VPIDRGVSCDMCDGEEALSAEGAVLLTYIYSLRLDFLFKGFFLSLLALWDSLLYHLLIGISPEP
jgi:hypothetical protein